MPSVEFVGSSRQDSDNRQADTSRLINCYREPTAGSRTQHVIKSVLGQQPFADLENVFLRDMETVGGTIYAVCGAGLYSVSGTGVVTRLGDVIDGDISLSSNNGKVTVAAGGDYYVWDGSTLTTPATGAFTAVGSVTFLGQYTVITEAGGRRFSWSAVADATTFDALDFATKEGRDDNILRCTTIAGRLWLFGEQSAEVWYPQGTDFVRVPGGVIDTGLKSYGLLTEFDQGAFLIGDDGIVYICDGGTLAPVSSRAVETAIKYGSPTSCFYYEDEGHKFCVIRFTDRPAWVFDLSTKEWHERAYGMTHEPWHAVASVKLGSMWYVGTDLGAITGLARINTDTAAPLRRRMVSNTLWLDGDPFKIAEFEVYPRIGFADLSATLRRTGILVDEDNQAIVDDDGNALQVISAPTSLPRDAKCWIRVSRDNGHTWSREKWESLGRLGQYGRSVCWKGKLGWFRQFATVELNCTEPAEIPFNSTARVKIA